MPLCFIEPQNAIRVIADSVGREARRQILGEVVRAWVDEIPESELEGGASEVDVHVTASNCVQCGAITAKGGRLTLPEGGDGPLYQET